MKVGRKSQKRKERIIIKRGKIRGTGENNAAFGEMWRNWKREGEVLGQGETG